MQEIILADQTCEAIFRVETETATSSSRYTYIPKLVKEVTHEKQSNENKYSGQ